MEVVLLHSENVSLRYIYIYCIYVRVWRDFLKINDIEPVRAQRERKTHAKGINDTYRESSCHSECLASGSYFIHHLFLDLRSGRQICASINSRDQ